MGAFDTYLKDRGTPSRSTGGAFNSFIKEKTGMDLSPLDKFDRIRRKRDEEEKKYNKYAKGFLALDEQAQKQIVNSFAKRKGKEDLGKLQAIKRLADSGYTPPDEGAEFRLSKGEKIFAGAVEGVTSLPRGIYHEIGDKIEYLSGKKKSAIRGAKNIEAAQKKAQSLPEETKKKAADLGPGYSLEFLKMVDEGSSDKEIDEFIKKAKKAQSADIKEMAGAGLEAASFGIGTGSAFNAFLKGGSKAAAVSVAGTAASGVAGGAGYELRTNPEADIGDIAESAAYGGAFGALVGGGSLAYGKIRGGNKAATQAILDESRLLPAQASQGADVITDEARILGPGAADPNLAVPVANAGSSSALKRLDAVERKITQAQRGGRITPTEARGLMQERRALVEEIRTGGSKEAQQTVKQVQDVVNTHQTYLRTDLNGEHFVPRTAQRTEARAVADKLTDSFNLEPTATRMSLDDQANRALDFIEADYEAAKRVAMGVEPPPQGIEATTMYKAVEARAAKQGDVETLQALATESVIPQQATRAGQSIAALGLKDPESPVDIMRSINKIRGESPNANVPKFVTADEAERLTTMAADVGEKRAAAMANLTDKATRLEYGYARVALDNYVEALKGPALKRTARQTIKEQGYVGAGKKLLGTVAGSAKSIVASIDNSAIGRQGLKVLFTSPKTWAKNSLKSFDDIVKQFGGKEVKDALKAEIISRPNALNGLYKRMGADVIDITEEAFPETLPERIWGIGRAFKASDAAYTGFVQRSRADLADKYLQIAKRTGVDLTDVNQLKPIGKLINALTGRGYLKNSKPLLNRLFFSPALMKSHVDVLTAHAFQKGVTPFVRKQAALNLLRMVSGVAAILKFADMAKIGSVEWDPRSADFGNIRIGNTRFDVTGGMKSVVTLASRLSTMSTKSSTTGDVNSLWSKDFGATNGADLVENFFENKLAPGASVVRDLLKGETFQGDPVSIKSVAKSLFVPLSVANYFEMRDDPKSANKLLGTIADGLGISTNTYGVKQTDWRTSKAKEITAFKQKVSEQEFLEANDKFNEQYVNWLDSMQNNSRYQKLSTEDRSSVRTNKQNEIRRKVLKGYGFYYKRASSDNLKGF